MQQLSAEKQKGLDIKRRYRMIYMENTLTMGVIVGDVTRTKSKSERKESDWSARLVVIAVTSTRGLRSCSLGKLTNAALKESEH
jgi:hypothetical protein